MLNFEKVGITPNLGREFKFEGLIDPNRPLVTPKYPHWMYKDGHKAKRVKSIEEEEQARAEGYDDITAGALGNHALINWFWDLEDMSEKQLVIFAREEFDIELPIEAGQDTLFQIVLNLVRNAPQNRNRIVFMAHTIEMEYDASLEEIKRMVKGGRDIELETESYEITV